MRGKGGAAYSAPAAKREIGKWTKHLEEVLGCPSVAISCFDGNSGLLRSEKRQKDNRSNRLGM